MATEAEIDEVRRFLAAHANSWDSPDDHRDELPEVCKRLKGDDWPIAYDINSVIAEAGLPGGVEEHGHGDWLVLDGSDPPEEDEELD